MRLVSTWHCTNLLTWILELMSYLIVIFLNEFTLSFDLQALVHISRVQEQSITITDTAPTDNTRLGCGQSPCYAFTPEALDSTFQVTPQSSIYVMLASKNFWISKCIKVQPFKIQTICNNSNIQKQTLSADRLNTLHYISLIALLPVVLSYSVL